MTRFVLLTVVVLPGKARAAISEDSKYFGDVAPDIGSLALSWVSVCRSARCAVLCQRMFARWILTIGTATLVTTAVATCGAYVQTAID